MGAWYDIYYAHLVGLRLTEISGGGVPQGVEPPLPPSKCEDKTGQPVSFSISRSADRSEIRPIPRIAIFQKNCEKT